MSKDGDRLGAAAPNTALPARARLSITDQLARIDKVTAWLASGMTPRQTSTKCKEEYGLRRYQADRYVAVALKRLQSDGADEPIESKRARLLAMHYETVRMAEARTRTVGAGRDNIGNELKETIPDPDLRARTAALEAIERLEGVTKP